MSLQDSGVDKGGLSLFTGKVVQARGHSGREMRASASFARSRGGGPIAPPATQELRFREQTGG